MSIKFLMGDISFWPRERQSFQRLSIKLLLLKMIRRVMRRCRQFPVTNAYFRVNISIWVLFAPCKYIYIYIYIYIYLFLHDSFLFHLALILSSLSNVCWIIFDSTYSDSDLYWSLLLLDLCLRLSVKSHITYEWTSVHFRCNGDGLLKHLISFILNTYED